MAETITTPPSATTTTSPWRVVTLVVGDALSFLVFAGLGRNQHGETSGLAALGQVALTALPFALGWFLVSPWVGAYRRAATDTVARMLKRTELAWIATYPVALILRVLIAPDHKMPITFAIVILLANAIILGVWRSVFALVERRIGHSA
ncbi:MAG TPA: DUF3054 domain-containing protein [Ktedonobacterales bacterium]|jgi:uncharacterized protein YacL|nr:DUF3054 domain-containing protein [Ktedonobacterales bacterium]